MAGRAPQVEVRSAGDKALAELVEPERAAAQRLADATCALLDVDLSGRPLSVLLVPFMAVDLGLTTGQDGQTTLLRMVGPDGDAPPLPLLVTVELVERAFGSAEPVVSVGLAGVVAARTGVGPDVTSLVTAVRQVAAERGLEPGDLLASAFGEREAELDYETFAAATAFVQHLVEEFGPRALPAYLRAAASSRRDEAAVQVFGRPLAQLVHEWSSGAATTDGLGQPLRSLWRHMRPIATVYRWRFAEMMSYVLVGVGFTVLLPLTTKYLLDTVLPQRDTGRLVLFVLVLLGAYVYRALLGIRTAYVSSVFDQRLFFGLQQRMFAHIQRLSHDFHDRTSVGDLMSRMSNDLGQGQQAFSQLVVTPVPALLNLVAALTTIFVLDWRFGVGTLLFLPVLVVVYRLLGPRVRATSLRQQQAQGSALGTLQEALAGQSALKAMAASGYAERSYASRVDQMHRTGMQMSVYGAALDAAVGFTTSLPLLAVLGFGGYAVTTGEMTLGTLVALVGLLPSVVQPVTELSNVAESLQRASGALHRISELLDEPVTIDDPAEPVAVPPLTDGVELSDVSFSYPAGRPALDHVDLRLAAGTHTAVVGPSGSGKSTLLGLLMRFYDPDSGAITVDGVDVRALRLDDLRSSVGLVSQDTVIFDATLRENVVLGRPGVSDEQIDRAIEGARLTSFVRSLPEGLDTLMGERGARLSGGQRQRIGIARAVLRDPVLLLLDEPTSALDRSVEQEVMETLATARRGRTTVTVTHRVDTVASADLIVVMVDGKVAEQGRHTELVRAGGVYADLLSHEQSVPVGWAALDAVSLFADAPREAVGLLEQELVQERHEAGAVLVEEGAPADAVHVVVSGRVEVVVGTAPLQRRLRVLGPGDAFGELALAGVGARTATVRALDDVVVGRLTVAAVEQVADLHPELRTCIDRHVDERRAVYEGVPGGR